jgi:PAS domain S-box-containing protein
LKASQALKSQIIGSFGCTPNAGEKTMFKFGKPATEVKASGKLNDPEVLLSILDNLPTSIFVKDKDLRFVYSNAGHCEMIGKSEADLLGKSDADFYTPEMARMFLANDRSVLTSGRTNENEDIAARKDGGEITVFTRKSRLQAPDGKTYLIGTNTDLTEIKRREQQYRMLAESVPVGILQINDRGAIQFSNSLALQQLGLSTKPTTLAEIRSLFETVENDFPGRPVKFETSLGSTVRRLLLISSGWNSTSQDEPRSAIVSIVDVTAMAQLRSKVEEKSGHLGMIVNQTRESVAAIGRDTSSLNNGAVNLSKQTEAQMVSLQTMSIAVRQLADAVSQNSENSTLASKLSLDATLVADEGHQMSQASSTAIERITSSTQKIVSIVDLIQEIAFQTNLLALNAAVEAARAGEAGRGFAVVATEVRTLAQRSAQALKDVRIQINESNQQIIEGEKLISAMGSKLGDIARITKQTAALVTNIASASHEQATGVQQVSSSVNQLEKVAQFNSQLVGKVTQSVESVDRAMGELIKFVEISGDEHRNVA